MSSYFSLYIDCKEFTKKYVEKTDKKYLNDIDVDFISRMIKDEFEELKEAKDEAEEIDALLDAVYYILNHLAMVEVDISKHWKKIINSYMINPKSNWGFTDMITTIEEIYNQSGVVNTKRIHKDKISGEVHSLLESLQMTTNNCSKIEILLRCVFLNLLEIISSGINVRPIWKLIHNANMTKFGPGGYKRDDGKWMKPKNFIPPDDDIREEIKNQRQ